MAAGLQLAVSSDEPPGAIAGGVAVSVQVGGEITTVWQGSVKKAYWFPLIAPNSYATNRNRELFEMPGIFPVSVIELSAVELAKVAEPTDELVPFAPFAQTLFWKPLPNETIEDVVLDLKCDVAKEYSKPNQVPEPPVA